MKRRGHKHTCVDCGYSWTCKDPEWQFRAVAKCGVTQSARSNKDGPYCSLCHHIVMAGRFAEARGFVNLIDAIQRRRIKK